MRTSLTSVSRYSHGALVNSGCASRKSMMRRSGVRPAVWASKSARVTPRRAAYGHSSSRQLRKFAAAARIASACMAGWPDAPDSPLQSVVAVAGWVTALVEGNENKLRRSKPCASARLATVAPSAKAESVTAAKVTAPSVTAPPHGMDRNNFANKSAMYSARAGHADSSCYEEHIWLQRR